MAEVIPAKRNSIRSKLHTKLRPWTSATIFYAASMVAVLGIFSQSKSFLRNGHPNNPFRYVLVPHISTKDYRVYTTL